MRDKPLNPAPETADLELERRLTRVLEAAPIFHVPTDFAARVAARVTAPPPLRQTISIHSTRYGYYAMVSAMLVLLIALLVQAHGPVDHPIFAITVQWALCAQFIGLVVLYSVRRQDLR